MPEYYKRTPCGYCGQPIETDTAISIKFVDRKTKKSKEVLVHNATLRTPSVETQPIEKQRMPMDNCRGHFLMEYKADGFIESRVELTDRL
ncbi:hypothetical protein HYT92_01960 [Candidatus Pacearchaeota archaeon]|nr:hypothetical protein [Candidatus Pacearchaeota archaeon]